MRDSKGNNFGVGDVLVSSQCPNTDLEIICKSVTGNTANFEHHINHLPTDDFCLNQDSLDTSK